MIETVEAISQRENISESVIEDILMAMDDLEMDSDQLAKRTNQTVTYIESVLGGEISLTLDVLSDICHVLGTEPRIDIGYL